MNIKSSTPFALLAIVSLVLTAGCENPDRVAENNNPAVAPHKTLKVPIDHDFDDPADESPQIDPAAVATSDFQGEIAEVGEMTISVKLEDDSIRDFSLTPSSTVTLDDAPATLSQLAPGQQIQITAEVKEDLLNAVRVEARSMKINSADEDNAATESGTTNPEAIKKDASTDSPAAKESDRVEGVIKSVSLTELAITDGENTDHQFIVPQDVRVTLDEEEASIDNLVTGQFAVVIIDVSNDIKTAREIAARTIKATDK